MKLSELNTNQLSHLVWRLDTKTACGLITANRIARKEFGDHELVQIFQEAGNCTSRSAKYHARKVEQFSI
jgi:hypothetical protein